MDEASKLDPVAAPALPEEVDDSKRDPSLASKRLMQLSSRLVQITRANPTIRLLKQPKERVFDVAQAEAFKAGTMRDVLEKILADKSVTLVSNKQRPRGAEKPKEELEAEAKAAKAPKRTRDEFRKVQAWTKLSSTLTALRRKKNAIYEESGSQDFYLGFPWISGCCSDEDATFVQAPLLLFPVDLTIDRKAGQKWKLSPAQNEYPIFNTTLVQALERFDGNALTNDFIEAAEEFADDRSLASSPEKILEWFGRELKERGVDISVISYPLAPLPQFKAAEVPKTTRGFQLSANVVFGILPLANSALRNDYEALTLLADDPDVELPTVLNELLAAEATEKALPELEEGDLTMDSTPESETCFVIPSDSSQEEVLLEARKSRCLVVHGPPGTGKSQVIVNLISDAIARNERVLVCCQKRAALDVVYQRLDKYGLARHCGLIHDASNDRRELFSRIAAAMDEENTPAAAPDFESDIARLATKIDEKTASLKDMAQELHRKRRCGLRARALYARCAGIVPPSINFAALAATIDDGQLEDLLGQVLVIGEITARVGNRHPWHGRRSFATLSSFDKDKVASSLVAPKGAAAKIAEAFEALAMEALTPRLLNDHAEAFDLIESWQKAIQVAGAGECATKLSADSLSEADLKRTIGVIREHLPTLSKLPDRPKQKLCDDPGQMAYQLEIFAAKYGSFFKFLDGEFRDAKKVVLPYLGAQGIAQEDAALGKAIEELRSQQRWTSFELDATDLSFNEGLLKLRSASELADRLAGFEAGLNAHESHHALATKHSAFLAALETSSTLQEAAKRLPQMREAHGATANWVEATTSLDQWLTEEAMATLIENSFASASSASEMIAALDAGLADFEDLLTLDVELAKLSEPALAAYRLLSDADLALGDWRDTLNRGVLFAWLEEVERETPDLREVSSPGFARVAESFIQDIEARRTLNQKRLQHQLFKQATEHRFEPGRVTDKRHRADKPFRELAAQVNKKSRLWSLRRLIATYWWPLREIMPVWLVSPETLSAAFPLERDLFDLVIFDEASQCAVEHGLPATYRGKRIVIAGDEQQLQPSKQFQTKSEFIEDDGESDSHDDDPIDSEAVEAESILRLARTRFPQRMLTWHYRSKFEELIDFSNHGFYEGRLKTVPDTLVEGSQSPIQYIKVEDGAWRQRANEPEANVVIDTLYELLLEHEDRKSIGVITFNTTQREKILDLIDKRSNDDFAFAKVFTKAFSPASGNLDEALFVKNIENVQGDERDIILFSVGYGPAEDGRVRAQFGSLSQEGGENRLNVAVSRAKERIIVVASIEPEQLNVAGSKNRGPRLIRAYLEYARAVSKQSEEMRQSVLKDINPVMDAQPIGELRFESPFEEQVHKALVERGLKVDSQVGVSGYSLDLAIVDPNMESKYVIGVECDGATYHSAPSVRERDAYRQRFLESRGWVMHRIWSRNWWQNPEREIDALVALVEKHQSAPEAVKEKEDSISADESAEKPQPDAPLGEEAAEETPQGWQGEWPPEGEIRAWIEERRDGFHWFAIGDFGEQGRLDEMNWSKTRLEARYDCEKAQVVWLSDRKIPVNQYVQPENSEEEAAPDANDE